MSEELELVRGSDNVFRDVGLPDADSEQIKAQLAAEIIRILRERSLTNAAAARQAGIQEADISRIRNADLDRFTIDRLVKVLNGLGLHVGVTVSPQPLAPA
ncbi:MAG: helix-turn-helix domain-containing protein [Nitrococcus sp.]|nr:helix-turn-helix domain-containing protein [Nitrococcus sp.]